MRNLFVVLFCCISLSGIAGGEKFQINFLISPTGEWLWFSGSPNAPSYNALWGKKVSYNFGIEYKRFSDPSLSFSTGVMYMNKGFRNVDPLTGPSGKNAVALYSAHIVAVPLYLNIHQDISRKIEMIYTAGIAGGYIISERVRSGIYSGEDNPEEGLFQFSDTKGNIDLLNDLYIGLHLGVGISAYLKSRIVLVVQPMYKFQLNNAHDYLGIFAPGDPFAARLNSFGVDLKLGYFFTNQIKNRRKDI